MRKESAKIYFRACGFIEAINLIENHAPEREICDRFLKDLFALYWKEDYQKDGILDCWYALNIFIAGFKDMEIILRIQSKRGRGFLAFLRGE